MFDVLLVEFLIIFCFFSKYFYNLGKVSYLLL
jgi:hypothetical protein